MKYGIWRHENAFGNSAEHTVGLAKHLYRTNDPNPIIYVENEWQKDFALCIKDITPPDVHIIKDIFKENDPNPVKTLKEKFFTTEEYKDVYMPEVYAYGGLSYPAMWADLNQTPSASLEFPYDLYQNELNIPSDAIVIQFREHGTFWKRVDGDDMEPNRFVNPQTFFDIATHYANQGYKVIRLGDTNMSPMPEHENILDLAKISNKTMMDDLYAIAESKVFLSCDSGIWPMAGGMKKNMVLSNIASTYANNKMEIVNWLPSNSTCLFKNNGRTDNTFEEIITAVNKFL